MLYDSERDFGPIKEVLVKKDMFNLTKLDKFYKIENKYILSAKELDDLGRDNYFKCYDGKGQTWIKKDCKFTDFKIFTLASLYHTISDLKEREQAKTVISNYSDAKFRLVGNKMIQV